MGFVILVWLAFSIFIGVRAKARGRSGVGWFLISVFFSPPLAALALLFLPAKSSSAAESGSSQGGQIECLKCGELIARNDKVCPFCGFEVLPEAATSTQAQGDRSAPATSNQR